MGMNLDTIEEAQNYYENDDRKEGFWIRIRSSSKTISGSSMVTNRQFVCTHIEKYVRKSKTSINNVKKDNM